VVDYVVIEVFLGSLRELFI